MSFTLSKILPLELFTTMWLHQATITMPIKQRKRNVLKSLFMLLSVLFCCLLPFLRCLRVKDLGGSVLGVNLFYDALKDAFIAEDEGSAESAHSGFAIHLLLSPGAEILEHLGGGVGEKSERKVILGPETSVGLGAVFAHAHNVVAGLGKGCVVVSEAAGLGSAAGSVVLRVEIDDGFLAFANEVFAVYSVAVLVQNLE